VLRLLTELLRRMSSDSVTTRLNTECSVATLLFDRFAGAAALTINDQVFGTAGQLLYDSFNADARAQPPKRRAAEVEQSVRGSEGTPLSLRMLTGRPRS